MPFATKHNKRNKVQRSLEHYELRHFISPRPHTHLGEALSSMIQEN